MAIDLMGESIHFYGNVSLPEGTPRGLLEFMN